MAKLPQYERRVAPEGPGELDSRTGAADMYGAMRNRLAGLAGKVGAMADRAAASEGERDGLVAGLDPEFRPGRQNTIYGQARDRAGVRAFLDTQENRLREQMDALSIQYEADPDGLTAALADLESQTVSELEGKNFPEAQVAFAGLFSRARTSYVREALRAKTTKDEAVFLATANETINNRLNAIGRESYSGGLDEEAQKTVSGEVEAVRRTVEAGVDSGVYTPEQGRKIIEAAEKEGVFGTIRGTFDRLSTIQAKRKFLDNFREDYAAGGDLTNVLSLDDAEKLMKQMEVGIRAAESERAGALTGIDRAAGSIEDRAAQGFSAPETEIAALRAAAEETGDQAAIERVEAAERFRDLGEQLVTMTPMEVEVLRRQTVLDMEKNGATARSMEVLKAIDGVKGKMTTALNTDAYAWGARAGAIKPVPALNFESGAAMSASFAARVAARDTLRTRYGKVPFFTAAEKDAISYIARNGGSQALGLAQGIVNSLGKDAPDVLAEISEDAPVLANMAGRMLNGGSSQAAMDAMAAMEARKSKEFKPVGITEAQETIAARGKIGGAYMADPRSETAVRAEARLIFEKRARDAGLTGDLSNDPEALEMYERALDEAAGATYRDGRKFGGIDVVNGVKVIVPPDSPEGEIEELLNRVTDLSALPPIGTANGLELRAGQIQGATLVTAGNGRWRVALGDPRTADPRYVMTPDGDFWTVTIDDLRRAAPPAGSRKTYGEIRRQMIYGGSRSQ